MHPKLLEFGNFFLPTYGLFVALGFLAGMLVTRTLANRRGLDSEFVVGAALYTALVGLAGAKLALIIQDFSYYARNPEQLISLNMLQSAGIFYGGVIAGLLFFVWYFRKHNMDIAAAADCLAPGLAIGHALGRMGCFFGGCCFGEACERPWAVTYTNAAVRDFSNVRWVCLCIPRNSMRPPRNWSSFWCFGRCLDGSPSRAASLDCSCCSLPLADL